MFWSFATIFFYVSIFFFSLFLLLSVDNELSYVLNEKKNEWLILISVTSTQNKTEKCLHLLYWYSYIFLETRGNKYFYIFIYKIWVEEIQPWQKILEQSKTVSLYFMFKLILTFSMILWKVHHRHLLPDDTCSSTIANRIFMRYTNNV